MMPSFVVHNQPKKHAEARPEHRDREVRGTAASESKAF
jgi:hypothetical protein